MDKWKEIWHTITQNRSRSFLTAFGVFWGIFMLVILVGLGNGMRNTISGQISWGSTNSFGVYPQRTTEPYKGFQQGRYWRMEYSDLAAIKQQVPDCELLSPMISNYPQGDNVSYKNKTGTYNENGLTPAYGKLDPPTILYGRFLNDVDIQQKRKVCILGKTVYDELFEAGQSPIGEHVRVNNLYYQVVGVIEDASSGINITGPINESIVLPLTTMQQAYHMGNDIGLLMIAAREDVPVKQVGEKVKAVLCQRHQISPTDQTAVGIFDLSSIFTMTRNVSLGVLSLVWLVGIGTLIAGAVGVSNIMLITIKERTKEIGVRRAIGATPRHIITQIMLESLLLTFLAGIVGIMVGVGILQIVEIILAASPDANIASLQISFGISMLALLVLIIVGLAAGLLPTVRALAIRPVEALSDE